MVICVFGFVVKFTLIIVMPQVRTIDINSSKKCNLIGVEPIWFMDVINSDVPVIIDRRD